MKGKLVSLVLATCCASGCTIGPIYRQRGVTSDDPAKIAIIQIDPCQHSQCLIIVDIDGKWRGPGWITRYELLPGIRTLKLEFVAPYIHGARDILVRFDAQSGHTYQIEGNVSYAAMHWHPEVIDSATGQLVSREVGTASSF